MNELEESPEELQNKSLVLLKIANILYDYIDWVDFKNKKNTNFVFLKVFGFYLESYILDFNNSYALLGLINFYRKKKKYGESIKFIDKALLCKENEYRIYFEVALTYYEIKNYEKTEELLELCLMYNSRYCHAYHLLGNLMLQKNLIDKAFDYYEFSLKINPSKEIYNNIGDYYLRKVRN